MWCVSSKYITYELSRNGLVRGGSLILNQVKRLPMGGQNSAQLACIYMACCEMNNTAVALFRASVIACRYRNNLYFFARKSKKKCFSNALRHSLVVLEMH